jgi:two-component system response regulator DevR
MPTRDVQRKQCWSWQTIQDRPRPAGDRTGRVVINSEMLWTGSTALRPASGDADLGWTDAPPSGRHAGLGATAATTTAKVDTATAQASTETITVYLLDDHEIVRLGLKDLLESEGDIQVIGESGSVAHAPAQILALQPQVAVLDGRLPDGSGIDVCRDIRSRDPNIASLILTSYDDDEALFAAIMAGAAGYVLKQIRGSDLIDSVRRVAAGQSLLDPAVTARVLERVRRGPDLNPALAPLTNQERRVLSLIGEGMTNRQIAESLFLAEKTVKNYVSSLLDKLGLQRRTQAALFAARHLPE